MVGALTIAFDPRYMPRLLCGRCVTRLPTLVGRSSSSPLSATPEEAFLSDFGREEEVVEAYRW